MARHLPRPRWRRTEKTSARAKGALRGRARAPAELGPAPRAAEPGAGPHHSRGRGTGSACSLVALRSTEGEESRKPARLSAPVLDRIGRAGMPCQSDNCHSCTGRATRCLPEWRRRAVAGTGAESFAPSTLRRSAASRNPFRRRRFRQSCWPHPKCRPSRAGRPACGCRRSWRRSPRGRAGAAALSSARRGRGCRARPRGVCPVAAVPLRPVGRRPRARPRRR